MSWIDLLIQIVKLSRWMTQFFTFAHKYDITPQRSHSIVSGCHAFSCILEATQTHQQDPLQWISSWHDANGLPTHGEVAISPTLFGMRRCTEFPHLQGNWWWVMHEVISTRRHPPTSNTLIMRVDAFIPKYSPALDMF